MFEGYKHHIFISYSRSGDVPDWLHNHFLPVLSNRLEAVLDEDPQIFVDRDIPYGAEWPDALADALRHSCHLLAVWSPRYFRSSWCLAEWRTMLEREKALGLRPGGDPGLVYPVVFSDGEHFPEEAKKMQYRTDLRDFAYPYPQFRTSEKYLNFHDRMVGIANDIKDRLARTPKWDGSWTEVRPEPEPLGRQRFQRL